MSHTLHKKAILSKTIQVGGSTLLSRLLGLLREILIFKYLPLGTLTDAFLTAFKIPNSLRKIFAEGALSAAFIPKIVKIMKKGDQNEADRLMTISFIFFEGIVLVLCALLMMFAYQIIALIAPGFPPEKVAIAAPLLQILSSFILFLSSSALIGGALQSVNNFIIPAISPIILNIVFVSSIVICMINKFPVSYLCYGILLGGLLQFVIHLVTFFKLGFKFKAIDKEAWANFKDVLKKFLPCLLSTSIMEVNLFLDTSFASYFDNGTSLIHLGSRFMGIALGVFAVAFSTILLPHFSRVSTYAPKRLSFYLLESAKLTFFITIPITIIMGLFSEKIFITLFLSSKFPISQVLAAKYVLIAFLIGLFFFSINKILLNIFYSLGETRLPAIISVSATVANFFLNYISLKCHFLAGLALATTFSGAIQTCLFIWFLHKNFNFKIYYQHFFKFLGNYLRQLVCLFAIFLTLYYLITLGINQCSYSLANFLLYKIGFWLWSVPLIGFIALLFLKSKKKFKVKLYFLD